MITISLQLVLQSDLAPRETIELNSDPESNFQNADTYSINRADSAIMRLLMQINEKLNQNTRELEKTSQ